MGRFAAVGTGAAGDSGLAIGDCRVSRFVIIHTESSMGWGGQELRILGEMQALRARGYDLGLIAQPGAEILARAREAGFATHAVTMRGALDLWAAVRAARILRADGARLLVTHSSVDAWVGGWAARWLGLPIVRTRHLAIRIRQNPFARRVYTWLADRIVTTGEDGRNILIEQAGVLPDRITVIPTGVDTERFHPERVDAHRVRQELGIQAGVSVIGVVAVLRTRKGHLTLLEALARSPLREPGVHLLVAGAGPIGQAVEERARGLGLTERVHFLGHREDVADILAACDVVVLPSIMGEGVPQVVLQAFALGRPVVASDVPGIRQVVQDGETGLLVPPEDPPALAQAIGRVLQDASIARRFGEAGRSLVLSCYSLEKMADALEAIYRPTAGLSPSGPARA
jgi:glycosyltransferase involved in cell wall biosynthesis